MELVSIFIDGGNFHHLVLKKLGVQELGFDFEKFAQFLANSRKISELGKRFYVGTVREEAGNARSREAMSQQTSFLTRLTDSKWKIMTSKLRTRRERMVIDDRVVNYEDLVKKGVSAIEFSRTREKGIDVKIAVDMLVGAIDNRYDTAILVSSDTDLVPAIDWIRYRAKKKVEYIGFSILDTGPLQEHTRPLQALIIKSDIQRILTAADLKPFIVSTQQSKLIGL